MSDDRPTYDLKVDVEGCLWLILRSPSGKGAMINLSALRRGFGIHPEGPESRVIDELASTHHTPRATVTINPSGTATIATP